MRWIVSIALAAALVYAFHHGGRDLLDEAARTARDGLRSLEQGMLASRGL